MNELRFLGSSGIEISAIGLGTSTFGWTASPGEAGRILDFYVDAGGNHIDTSPTYPQWVQGHSGGEAELIIGDWLVRSGRRDEVVLSTKVGKGREARGLSATAIRLGIDASLRRLRTDRVDVFSLHLWDSRVPIDETLEAADELVRAGKVRTIGVSNFTADQLAQSLVAALAGQWAAPAVAQSAYSLVERSALDDGLRRMVAREATGFVAHSALAKGFLSGKYSRDAPVGVEVDRMIDVESYCTPQGFAVLDVVQGIAAAIGSTPAAVSVAWVLSTPEVSSLLVSARSAAQLQELLDASDLELGAAELGALDAAGSTADVGQHPSS